MTTLSVLGPRDTVGSRGWVVACHARILLMDSRH